MISDMVAIVRKTVNVLLAGSSPRQLAVGFTLGMMIGIMPKPNLIALTLCVFMFSTRCNKALGILAAIGFSCIAPWSDVVAHKIGYYVLTLESLQATYASIYNLPVGPWIGINNTVVMGSFLLGLYIAYPVYWVTCLVFRIIRSMFVGKPAMRLGVDAELQPRAAA